jgi:hypothetical protein
MMLAAAPAVILTWAVADRVGGASSPPTWGKTVAVIVGLEYMFGTMTAFLFAPPRPHGTHAGGSVFLRIPPWRRAAIASMLPVPALMFSVDDIIRGAISPAAVAAVALAAVAALVVTNERVAISAAGIERIAGIGRHHRIAWSEIWRLEIWQAGLRVRGEKGKSIHVPGLWMDGYPELVAMLLEQAPAELLRQLPDDVRERLVVIADLADPGGRARRRGELAKA